MRLGEYLDRVSDFWKEDDPICHHCNLYDEDTGCEMLFGHLVPNDDCLGLVQRFNIVNPWNDQPPPADTTP